MSTTDHPLTETVHAHADRGLAAQIRAILNGETQ